MGNDNELDMKYPDLISQNPSSNPNSTKFDKDIWPNSFLQFDIECPRIKTIEIKGHWYNKYPVCTIEYDTKTFERKLKYFRWLWVTLRAHAWYDKLVPDFPYDIPESHWPEGYLRRRKKELNLFLQQCYNIEWIREHEAFKDIFLEDDNEKFNEKRKKYKKKYC